MEERVKYLFQKYLDNSCTRKEFEEFLVFVRRAGNDEQLRALIRRMYENSGQMPSSDSYVDESGKLVLPAPPNYDPVPPVRPRRIRKNILVLTMATILIAAACYVWWDREPELQRPIAGHTTELTRKSTERSENRYVLLPDSTQVWLNAASSLEFPQQFDGNSRVVYLSGEAYFDVKHANKIPFIIYTGKVTTTVLGTAFNIKAYPDRKDVIVSVSRGKVKVDFNNEEVATLTKGQQVKVSNTIKKVVEKKPAVNEAAAWQQGFLVYDDETMDDIIADLQRVYDVKIRIVNASISSLRVSTSFRRETGVEYVLQVLCKLTDTGFKQADGQYIII